jgi:hypothetical protein
MLRGVMRLLFTLVLSAGIILGVAGCNSSSGNDQTQQQRDEKTREEIAKATERMKPAIEDAGRALGNAAERASEEARAACARRA